MACQWWFESFEYIPVYQLIERESGGLSRSIEYRTRAKTHHFYVKDCFFLFENVFPKNQKTIAVCK